jgi:hypothetical protein
MTRCRLFALLAFLLPLALYALTTAPSIYWEDSAAFQTAAHELGIVHNPSFPIYILLARVFSLIPLGSPEFMVNLASGVMTALSALFLYLISTLIARRIGSQRPVVVELISLITVFMFAGIYAVWVQAVRAEVYALNLLLCLSAIWLMIKYYYEELDTVRFSAMLGLIFGLGCANHYLLFGAAVVLPLTFLFIVCRRKLVSLPNIATTGLFGLVGLSVYLYLPIRERFSPMFNWGDFSTLSATLRSILRLDEALPVAVATATTPFLGRLGTVIATFGDSLPLIALILALAGLTYLMLRHRSVFVLAALPLVTTLLVTAYAAEFSAYNLDLFGYMTVAYAMAMVASVAGGVFLVERASKGLQAVSSRAMVAPVAIVAVLIAIAAVAQVSANYDPASKRLAGAADGYTTAIFQRLPQNAIFLAGEDNSFSPLLCRQVVDGVRPDVAVLSTGALLRSDYRRKTQLRYPQLQYPDDWNRKAFAAEFIPKLAEWIKQNNVVRPVSLTLCEWTSGLIPRLVPNGFAYDYTDSVSPNAERRGDVAKYYAEQSNLWSKSEDITTREHFGRLLYNQAVYNIKHQDYSAGVEYCRYAATADPTNVPLLLNCLKVLVAGGVREDQRKVAEAILALDPGNRDVVMILNQRKNLTVKEHGQ